MASERARCDVVNPTTSATITVHGPRQILRAFRKRVVDALCAEAPTARVAEMHGEERLEFGLTLQGGIPFPPLVAASCRYPDCVVTVHWEINGAQGETTIQNGQLRSVSQAGAGATAAPTAIALNTDGSLALGVALVATGPAARTLGYAATGEAETYFLAIGADGARGWFTCCGDAARWNESWQRSAAGAWRRDTPAHPLEIDPADLRELEIAAQAFSAHALWYAHAPLEETIVERTRAADGGRPLRAINVKSRVIAELGAARASRHLGACAWITRLLLETWAIDGQPA